MKPLYKRVLNLINSDMDERLGKIYIKDMFPLRVKEDMQELVRYLFNAHHNRIQNLIWMDKTTKKAALDKLRKFIIKVGYPDESNG